MNRALRRAYFIKAVVVAVLLTCVACLIRHIEDAAVAELDARFQLRVEVAERFLQAYVSDLLLRERRLAERELAAPEVVAADFDRMVRAFGFEAAVLLNADGRVIHVYPSKPELIGSPILARYTHLSESLRRGTGVSSVVNSAAVGAPIVGFAARYGTLSGVRVLSGAYDVTQTPLHAYVKNLVSLRSASTDLVDDQGVIIASSRAYAPRQVLSHVDPRLAQAVRRHDFGVYAGEHDQRLVVARVVSGTPWRLIAAVDLNVLHAAVRGARQWLYWVLFAAFGVAVIASIVLFQRLLDSRRALSAMNADLARLARMDRLTGLPNRMHIEEHLTRLQSGARRHKQALSVLMIDVDYFKRINDSHGHAGGDEVLRTLASRMAAQLRSEDMVGRWGGEEFVVLLPNTANANAMIVAERLRLVARVPIELPNRALLETSVSIGCATSSSAAVELLGQADKALYQAKELGRDRVMNEPSQQQSLSSSG